MNWKKGYQIIQAVACCLLVLLLSSADVRIFREGTNRKAEQPLAPIFTLEAAAEELRRLFPLFAISAGLTAIGLLLGVRDERMDRPGRDLHLERDLIMSRLASPGEDIQKERRQQRCIRRISRGLFGLCLVPPLLYCLNRQHFPSGDLEGMIASLASAVFPWIAGGTLVLMLSGVWEEKSVLREIAAAKAQMKAEKNAAAPGLTIQTACPGAHTLRTVLLLASVIFILIGIFNGSLKDVLLKAINICTECVGLG